MTIRYTARAVALAALLTGTATQTLAQAPNQAQVPNQPQPPARQEAPGLTMDQARRIATENGVDRIEDIKLDGDTWEIEGRDSAGAEIEINLRASDGFILKMKRERPISASRSSP